MNRRIGLWMLVGLTVACCWAVVAALVGPPYNPGRSTVAAFTAPALLIGRRMPLGMLWSVLLNGVMYAVVGFVIELLRRPMHHH